MPFLQFSDKLGLMKQRQAEVGAVRYLRQVEQADPGGIPALVPLCGRAVGDAPGIRRVVKAADIEDRPVQEVGARDVRVLVGVEDIDDRELADGEDDAVGRLRAAKLVEVRIQLLDLTTEIDSLAEE